MEGAHSVTIQARLLTFVILEPARLALKCIRYEVLYVLCFAPRRLFNIRVFVAQTCIYLLMLEVR
jgi:hypothetical protein